MSILFLSDFPTADNLKDGMMQRVAAVDKYFEHIPRKYLSCSLTKNVKRETIYPAENVVYEKVNILLHCVRIMKEICYYSPTIYIHSVYNFLPLFVYYRIIKTNLKNKVLILDVHGIVPEELKFYRKRLIYSLFKTVEVSAFKTIDKAIFVTHKMEMYLLSKYPKFKGNCLVYNIYPKSITGMNKDDGHIKGLNRSKNVVIYSGNAQKWQNVDLMMETIKANISEKIEYVILTGEKKIFEKLLQKNGLSQHVKLLSLTTDQLAEVYKIANYGFLLRTDMPINMVANPTKMIEYLHFGVIPIVLSEKIGDFYDMGYEYIKVQDFSDKISKKKSEINRLIARKVETENYNADILTFVSE